MANEIKFRSYIRVIINISDDDDNDHENAIPDEKGVVPSTNLPPLKTERCFSLIIK